MILQNLLYSQWEYVGNTFKASEKTIQSQKWTNFPALFVVNIYYKV